MFESLLSTLWGLANFQVFIAPTVLILVYYLGTLGGPLIMVLMWRRVSEHRPELTRDLIGRSSGLWQYWPRTALGMTAFAMTGFFLFEVFWRILFETLIAYFQMRDFLFELSRV